MDEEIIDLTNTISIHTQIFPGSPKVSFLKWSNFNIDGYDSEVAFFSTHTGTHMDAPSHFISGKDSIDKININRFFSEALLLKIPRSKNELVSLDDLSNFKKSLLENKTIIFSTGWEKYNNEYFYMSSNPGLSDDVAKFLVECNVNAVAIDGPNIDSGNNHKFSVHKILLENNILIIENLCNLNQLANYDKFRVIMLPLKLDNASGSPIRILAICSRQ